MFSPLEKDVDIYSSHTIIEHYLVEFDTNGIDKGMKGLFGGVPFHNNITAEAVNN